MKEKKKERERKNEFFSFPFSPPPRSKNLQKTGGRKKNSSHLLPRSEAEASQRARTILGTAKESVPESQARASAGRRRVAGEVGDQLEAF